MTRKKRIPGPRLHRLKRAARLSSAKTWLPTYDGKKIVHGYRKRYGVDLLCAISELQMLNVRLDPTYVAPVRTTVNEIKRRTAATKNRSTDMDFSESDTTFSFIAGYTEGGAPFGLTWEDESQFFRVNPSYFFPKSLPKTLPKSRSSGVEDTKTPDRNQR
jgi:hypothetical protein